jgi:hypothetical protein
MFLLFARFFKINMIGSHCKATKVDSSLHRLHGQGMRSSQGGAPLEIRVHDNGDGADLHALYWKLECTFPLLLEQYIEKYYTDSDVNLFLQKGL